MGEYLILHYLHNIYRNNFQLKSLVEEQVMIMAYYYYETCDHTFWLRYLYYVVKKKTIVSQYGDEWLHVIHLRRSHSDLPFQNIPYNAQLLWQQTTSQNSWVKDTQSQTVTKSFVKSMWQILYGKTKILKFFSVSKIRDSIF